MCSLYIMYIYIMYIYIMYIYIMYIYYVYILCIYILCIYIMYIYIMYIYILCIYIMYIYIMYIYIMYINKKEAWYSSTWFFIFGNFSNSRIFILARVDSSSGEYEDLISHKCCVVATRSIVASTISINFTISWWCYSN